MAASDAKVHARFYKEAVLNETKSKAEGRPIYDEMELVEFIIPGDRLTRPVARAKDRPNANGPTYAELHEQEYAAFKRNEERAASGTPLEHWPILTAGRVAELKALKIFSVEDLAGLSDGLVGRIGMGGRELREQARAYIDAAKSGAGVAELAAKNVQLEEQLAAMQAQIALLMQGKGAPAPADEDEANGKGTEKSIADCTDAELKAFIRKRTGEPLRGNIGREALIERATGLARAEAA